MSITCQGLDFSLKNPLSTPSGPKKPKRDMVRDGEFYYVESFGLVYEHFVLNIIELTVTHTPFFNEKWGSTKVDPH